MPEYLELDSYIWYGHMRRNKFGGGVGIMMRASMVPDVIYRGDPEEDLEWMIVIHEAQKVFIGSVYYPPQGSSISKRFIDKVQELQSQGFDFIIAGDWNARSETWNDTGSNKHGDHVEMLVELLDVPVLSDGMPTHISKVTKKLDGVLDFGIGSKPFAAMRLDEDYAARLRSDHIPVVFQLECSQGFDGGTPPMSTNDHTVCWNASSFDMAMWIMAVEDKFTPWMQRCSGVYDINVIWKDFMETFAEVADHIVGRRPKSKPSSGSWWTKDLTYLHSLKKSVRKAGQKFASTEIKSVHNQLQRTFNQRKRLAKELLSEKQERKFEQSMKTRWDAFKQLNEEYMHKKLGSVVI